MNSPNSTEILSTNIESIASSISVQVVTRVLTFGINLAVSRLVDPAVFGTAHVSFNLLETLSLCLLKEGFRRAALRTDAINNNQEYSKQQENRQKSKTDGRVSQGKTISDNISYYKSRINVAVFGSFVSIISTIVLSLIWMFFLEAPSVPERTLDIRLLFGCSVLLWYRLSIIFVSIGIVFQSLAEPSVTRCLLQGHMIQRSKIEGYCILARTLTTPMILYVMTFIVNQSTLSSSQRLSIGLLSFALSNVVFGIVWYSFFQFNYGNTIQSSLHINQSNTIQKHSQMNDNDSKDTSLNRFFVLPFQKLDDQHSYLSRYHKQLLPSYLILACEKVLLNEVERLALILLFSQDAWAVYALVSNLGSIICRLVFAPIEEIASVIFSSSIPYQPTSIELTKPSINISSKLRIPILAMYLGCEGLIGIGALVLGPPIAATVLYVLYGSRWIAIGSHLVLQKYYIHLFALSVNGILEAYMYSSASSSWLSRLQWIQASIWFIGMIGIVFLKFIAIQIWGQNASEIHHVILEVSALIYGNLFSTILRIFISVVFVISQIVSVQSDIPTLNGKVFASIQIIVRSVPRLFCLPFFGTIIAGAWLRFGINQFAKGGIEFFISKILTIANSPDHSKQLLDDYWLTHGLQLILTRELFVIAIAAIIVGLFSTRFIFHVTRLKHFERSL